MKIDVRIIVLTKNDVILVCENVTLFQDFEMSGTVTFLPGLFVTLFLRSLRTTLRDAMASADTITHVLACAPSSNPDKLYTTAVGACYSSDSHFLGQNTILNDTSIHTVEIARFVWAKTFESSYHGSPPIFSLPKSPVFETSSRPYLLEHGVP